MLENIVKCRNVKESGTVISESRRESDQHQKNHLCSHPLPTCHTKFGRHPSTR